MNRTRLSLYYLVTYLAATGLGLMVVPALTLKLLFASRDYDDAMPRFVGILMFALAMIVSQVIRLRAEALYPVTVVVRIVIWVYVLWLYFHTGETMFAAVLGVVGLGILLTGFSYLSERGNAR
jgi:hypothetical protein